MSSSLVQRLTLVAVLFSAPAAWGEPVFGTYVVLRWTTSPGAAGYRVYVGERSRDYLVNLDIGSQTANTVDGIVYVPLPAPARGRRYFCAVTAYNASGESDFSNEKEFIGPINAPVADAGPDQTGGVGQTLWLGSSPQADRHYFWLQWAGPPASVADRTSSRTSFKPSSPGAYEFVVVAYDKAGIASMASMWIVVADVSPTSSTPTPSLSTATSTVTPTATPTATSGPAL